MCAQINELSDDRNSLIIKCHQHQKQNTTESLSIWWCSEPCDVNVSAIVSSRTYVQIHTAIRWT